MAYEKMIREYTKHKKDIKHYVLSVPKNGESYDFLPIKDRDAWKMFQALHFKYKYERRSA